MTYPYDDEYMVYDQDLGMYVLTEKAAEQRGVSLSGRIRARGAVNPEIAVRSVLIEVSTMIYGYLHDHVINDNLLDFVIAQCPSVRPLFQKALTEQLMYYLQVGNLSRSTDAEKRKLAIDENAKSILDRRIVELGHPLTYAGSWRPYLWRWTNNV